MMLPTMDLRMISAPSSGRRWSAASSWDATVDVQQTTRVMLTIHLTQLVPRDCMMQAFSALVLPSSVVLLPNPYPVGRSPHARSSGDLLP